VSGPTLRFLVESFEEEERSTVWKVVRHLGEAWVATARSRALGTSP
jgi:hypothetical protein